MMEVAVPENVDPIFVSTARGEFVVTRRNKEGFGRFGLTLSPLEEENLFFARFFEKLKGQSEVSRWPNRFTSIKDGMQYLHKGGFPAHSIVVSSHSLPLDQEEVLAGLKVFSAPLPRGCVLLFSKPESVGFYTRVRDYVGLLFLNVDRTVTVVSNVDQ